MVLQPRRGEIFIEKDPPTNRKPRRGEIETMFDGISNSAITGVPVLSS